MNTRQASYQLLDYVRILEGKKSHERGNEILCIIEDMGIKPLIQTCRWTRSKNIIVDFGTEPQQNYTLFSAHYDVIKGSPGANDNASSVAVLLGLCNKLRNRQKGVRIVFFDREESWLRTPIISLGLLGSLSYVFKADLRHLETVYNIEFCGQGDYLAIWPVKGKEIHLGAVRQVEKVASSLGLPCKTAHIPWVFLSSDHLSFRLRGIPNAITLSLLPSGKIPVLERLIEDLSLIKLVTGGKPRLPEPLKHIHSIEDTSSRLDEGSLELMLSLVLRLIRLSP
jgi:hypothetical protein